MVRDALQCNGACQQLHRPAGGNLLDGATSYKESGFFSRFQGVFFLEILSVSVNSLPQRGTENY